MEEKESSKDYLIIDNMGRVKVPSQLLEHANIQSSAAIQFLNYKDYIVMKQVEFPPVLLEENKDKNLVRTIDNLGYIVIPKILREIHDIDLHDEIEAKVLNQSIIFEKKRQQNKSPGLLKGYMQPELSELSLLQIKSGRIKLPDFVLKSLNLEEHMQLQFFIKGPDTIVAKKHSYKFLTEGKLFFTGQSRVIKKDKYLNIPKQLRIYLNIHSDDILEIKTIGEKLIIKKAIENDTLV
ncbi:AbrB/MazE/SpoVT family DNA-binding domain-containing protein [Priestia aryabhattai]|uniref:AbrB/MazE/SpoVT family DNA-binding domain-containing protein n=1 Tax=Priestia aryabhattai TaxID=412384 RepID=UPI002E241921|nr:AbrB/MazE/SpoVT family DNA-binding domain-containing protein [Priestia aryabhattai]